MSFPKLNSLPLLSCYKQLQQRESLAHKLSSIAERQRRKLEQRYETVDRWKKKYRQAGDEREMMIHHKAVKPRLKLQPLCPQYEVTATCVNAHEALMHKLELLSHPHSVQGQTIVAKQKVFRLVDSLNKVTNQVEQVKESSELQRQIQIVEKMQREEQKLIEKQEKMLRGIVDFRPEGWERSQETDIL